MSGMDYDGYIPKYAFDEAEKFKKKFLRQNSKSASDLLYSFNYNKKGEAIPEFTVVPKENYNWPDAPDISTKARIGCIL